MIDFAPFRSEHLERLKLQGAQVYLQDQFLNPDYGRMLEIPGLAWSGLLLDEPIGAAGIVPLAAPWRAVAWALIGAIPTSEWLRVHRRVLHALEAGHAQGLRRIETAVKADFPAGQRWAKALGFTLETSEGMRGYGPNGETFLLYARVSK